MSTWSWVYALGCFICKVGSLPVASQTVVFPEVRGLKGSVKTEWAALVSIRKLTDPWVTWLTFDELVGFLTVSFNPPDNVWWNVSNVTLPPLVLKSRLGQVDGKVYSVWVPMSGSVLPLSLRDNVLLSSQIRSCSSSINRVARSFWQSS